MKRVRISISFKNNKDEPAASTSLHTEIETDAPGDLVRDVLESVKKHAMSQDLKIPLFGNGNVLIQELPNKVKSASSKEIKD